MYLTDFLYTRGGFRDSVKALQKFVVDLGSSDVYFCIHRKSGNAMLNKTQSISARLSPDDYAYLMSIDRNGAVTQSEKVRELIAMARESVGMESFTRAYISSAEAILPIRARYADESGRSLLVEALLEILAEGAAAVQVCADEENMALALEEKALPAIERFTEKLLLVAMQDNPRVASAETPQRIKQQLQNLLDK